MSNVTVNRSLQQNATGSAFAMAAANYAAELIKAFDRKAEFWAYTHKETITSGKSKEFPCSWRSADAAHTPGNELAGTAKPQFLKRTISVEDDIRVAHDYESDIDSFIAHFESQSERAKQHAEALIQKADQWIAQVVALGARTAAAGDFDAGNVVTVGAGGTITLHPSDGSTIAGTSIAAAFPRSLKGSKTLQLALQLIGEAMTQKHVPKENRAFFLSTYLVNVLRQDDTLLSRDYAPGNSSNDKLMAKIGLVEGFQIIETQNLPTADLSADATVPTGYRGDFTKSSGLAMADRKAVGTLVFGGGIMPVGPSYIEDKLSTLIGAKLLKGHGILRPEACGEIRITGS